MNVFSRIQFTFNSLHPVSVSARDQVVESVQSLCSAQGRSALFWLEGEASGCDFPLMSHRLPGIAWMDLNRIEIKRQNNAELHFIDLPGLGVV